MSTARRILFDYEPRLIAGIDPGLDGAIVLLGEQPVCAAMPTITVKAGKRAYDGAAIRRMLSQMSAAHIAHVYLEKQQAMPANLRGRAQGGASTFSTGYGFGLLEGILIGLQVPFTIVHPRTWQVLMFRDLPKSDTKAMARLVCRRLFPELDLRATGCSRKDHEGICDALLIAEYGRRVMNGGA